MLITYVASDKLQLYCIVQKETYCGYIVLTIGFVSSFLVCTFLWHNSQNLRLK